MVSGLKNVFVVIGLIFNCRWNAVVSIYYQNQCQCQCGNGMEIIECLRQIETPWNKKGAMPQELKGVR